MLTDLISVVASRSLESTEIEQAAKALLDPAESDQNKAALLRAWAKRGETAAELASCAEAFLPHAIDPGVRGSWKDQPLLDCCGTGGGGLNLLNISTGLMFVLGAMGIPVVKHGNRGLTKKSGSADVLEALEIKIDLAPARVHDCLEEIGCAFLFAPSYHPAFAAVAGARRLLAAEGQRSIFNLLGPLLNPARPEARLIGVFRLEHITLFCEALERMDCPRFTVACGEDAASGRMLGEISALGPTYVGGTIFDSGTVQKVEHRSSEKAGATLDSLLVINAAESAQRLTAILRGEERGMGREMLELNTAFASLTQGTASSLEEGAAQSAEAIDSGRAYDCLLRWQKFSRD